MFEVGEEIVWSLPGSKRFDYDGIGTVVASYTDRVVVNPVGRHDNFIILFVCDNDCKAMSLKQYIEETYMRSMKFYDISTVHAPYQSIRGYVEKDLPISHGNT